MFKRGILYFTIKKQKVTCPFYFQTIGHLLYGECLSQLHILNSIQINKFLDHKNGRTKSFPEVIRYKETTPRKLQQRKYTIIS